MTAPPARMLRHILRVASSATGCSSASVTGAAVIALGFLLLSCGWSDAWSAEQDKPLRADAFFRDFDEGDQAPTEEQLRSVLRPVPGHPGEIAPPRRADRPICRTAGLFRLAGAWGEDTALRVSVLQPSKLQFHFWNGTQGVTLQYYPQSHKAWAAYGTLREADAPLPAKFGLWATDEGRYLRSGAGTFEIHAHRGQLVLVRGDVPLLNVPLDAPVAEVYLQVHGLIRGLKRFSSMGVPESPPARRPFLSTRQPAELPWESQVPAGTSLVSLPDGQLELSADAGAQQAQAWTTLRGPGLYEYMFEVDRPGVGTGVYLGDESGKPLCRVGFLHNPRARQTLFELMPHWSSHTQRPYDAQRQITPFASRRQCLRLILGAGVAKLWTSGDAIHWSQVAPKAEPAAGTCWTVGLYCLPGQKPRSIRLCSLEVRQLDALASLAPESLQQYVGGLVEADSLESWEKQVTATRPADVAPDRWWRACVLRTLCRSTRTTLGQQLLDKLQERVVRDPGDPQTLLRFLEESTLLRSNDDWHGAERVALHAERLALGLACRGQPAPATLISRTLARLPFWTQRRLPLFSDKLVRQELVALVGEDGWEAVSELSRRMHYWGHSERPGADQSWWTRDLRHLVAWASAQSARQLPKKADEDEVAPVPAWRHPLIERLSREGYNVLAEFQAALSNQSYREAAQIISTSIKAEGLGLLPDKRDARLLISMPVAVEDAMREHPALGKAMQERFGPIGRLRLRQAIEAGDAAAVEAVALQFFGTESAAEATQWLGDRALGAGRSAEALDRYAAALRVAPADQQGNLLARLRLAGALSGENVGKPTAAPVQVGAARFSPAAFEGLVREMLAARQPASNAGSGQPASPQSGPVPGQYQARPWAQIDGQQVQRPGAVPDRGIDWAGRQTSVWIAGRQMIVNDRVQQYAFELPGGRQQWVARRTSQVRDQQWPLAPMQPVVLGARVFARRLAEGGPELVCLDAGDGRLLWSCRPGGHAASDPLILNDALYVLSASPATAGSEIAVSLVGLAAESGQIRMQIPLAEFRDAWRRQIPCRAAVAGSRIVASVGGCLLSCDASGRIHWLRRQIWISPPGDNYWSARPWFEQSHDPPLVCRDRIYATQPGVWGVECVELDSGRLVWRQALGGLTRMIGRTSQRLLVEAGDQILGLDLDSGRPLWCTDVENRLESQLCGRPGMLTCVQAEPGNEAGKPPQLAMLWIDPDTGHLKLRSVLNVPARPEPWLKPLVVHGDRMWCLLASVQEPARREILELVRLGEEKTAQTSFRMP